MIKVHSYESMGTFDGPGLRLVVFLQGCNFRCLYCANPDTIDACGGTPTSPDEILRMAVDQKPFYGRRGGVTFSGGEPTFQAAALAPLVRRLREAGIHVCIDTNGSIWNPAVEELLGLADLILLDVKQADPERHLALTGHDNARTLRTAAWLEEHGKPFWLRYVLVPGYSDAEADIRPPSVRMSAATGRSNGSSCCPTTRSEFTNTKRWERSTNSRTSGRIRRNSWTARRRCCANRSRMWW